jgi:hypothetical protein
MTDEIVIFPDSEALLVGYLKRALTARGQSHTVSTKHAARGKTSVAPTHILIALLGGAKTSLRVEASQFSIEVHADDVEDASALAELVRALIPGIAYESGSPVIGTTETARPVPFPDPLTGAPSYVQQHNIRICGSAV